MRYFGFLVFLRVLACSSSTDHAANTDGGAGLDGQAVDAQPPQDLASPDGNFPGDVCYNVYSSPGCGPNIPQPRCVSSFLLCLQRACSCDGQVIEGCQDFLVPFAYASPLGEFPTESPCDPHVDGGRD